MLNSTTPGDEYCSAHKLDPGYANLSDGTRKLTNRIRANRFKILLDGISTCSVAHWYFMPGLRFHRYWVRLAMTSFMSSRSELRQAIARAMEQTISPISFLEFDFAWKAVNAREPIQAYLDCSSPWLFPAMLLARRLCLSAAVLNSDARELEVIERLAKVPRNGRIKPEFRGFNEVYLPGESFDLVTSLSSVARTADDVGTVKLLWNALKPGGMLLLSLPCAPRRTEHPIGISDALANEARTYDESMLEDRVFAAIGQPRRAVVYGESQAPIGRATYPGTNGNISLSRYIDMGRRWRIYPAVRNLPGEGIIAMKFVKPEVNQVQ
jgi:SAM-dependent methyltransferase